MKVKQPVFYQKKMGLFGNRRGTPVPDKQTMAKIGKPREQRRGKLLYKENELP